MAELERADAGDRLVLCDQGLFGEHVDPGAFRVVERDRLGDSRGRIVPRLTAHALGFETPADVAELRVRIYLERQPGAARLIALLELNHEVADLGRQMGPAVLPHGNRKAYDLREIVDLPLEVGGLKCGVAESFDLNHCSLRLRRFGARR